MLPYVNDTTSHRYLELLNVLQSLGMTAFCAPRNYKLVRMGGDAVGCLTLLPAQLRESEGGMAAPRWQNLILVLVAA